MANPDGSRILFLISLFPPVLGGAETQADHLARAIAARGRPVDVLTCAVPGAPAREVRDGVTVHRALRLIRLPLLWGATHYLGSAAFLARHGGRYGAAVGFGLTAFHNPAAVRWGRATGRPVILRCECSGSYGDLQTLRGMTAGGWIRRSLRGAAALVALTAEMRRELLEEGFAPERVAVVPNGVDVELFRPDPATGRGAELVFVGRLAPQKGLADLVAAFARLAPVHPAVSLHLYGDGPDRAALGARAAALGVAGRVTFHGTVSPERVRAAFARAAVVVHPSVGEGLSCVLLEAMAAGCPIVATGIPANREAIVDGASGLLVPPGDPEALAAAVRRMLEEPGRACELGAGARRRAVERFSLGAVADRYLDLVDRGAGGGGPA